MKTEKLILNYQRRGIKLSVSDNKLHFSAPQNILTDEDKDILKKNKKEIIKFLLDHTESEIIVDEEDKYEKFPLTDIQLSYLVGQDNVYKFGGTNCKIYTEIEYEQIELNKAQYAWEQVILLSGDWIPVDLPKEISKYFPNAEIVSLGGATEAAIWSIYYPINIKQNYIRSIPYGKPLANQRFYILNEKGEETLDWISGDIYIAGKGLAIGYLGDPELTEKKFIYSRQLKERLYKTGDIGRYMPDGTIEFQGRSDFQVKIRGHRVELGEIEMAIVEILHPKDLKVITVNNNDVISVCMFAVLENESDALSKEELGKYLSEKIPQYMIPVYCEYLSEIPLTVNGKIDIKVLTSRAIEGMKKSRSRGKSEQKLSETEENIYKVWCELFNTTDISVDEDFFECGGDSILVVKLLTELETRYQYKMSLMDVYSSPTIYKMAECITNQQ